MLLIPGTCMPRWASAPVHSLAQGLPATQLLVGWRIIGDQRHLHAACCAASAIRHEACHLASYMAPASHMAATWCPSRLIHALKAE